MHIFAIQMYYALVMTSLRFVIREKVKYPLSKIKPMGLKCTFLIIEIFQIYLRKIKVFTFSS